MARKRRKLSPAQKQLISARMRRYWDRRRKGLLVDRVVSRSPQSSPPPPTRYEIVVPSDTITKHETGFAFKLSASAVADVLTQCARAMAVEHVVSED